MASSASTLRKPKDLAEIVQSSHHDVKEMENVLEKMFNMSQDDQAEVGHLRVRLEQQSQLIMILKRRADEVSDRNISLEKMVDELTHYRESAQDELAREVKKNSMIDARFRELAHNHEEMIKFKDEYKTQNDHLRSENANLKAENARRFNDVVLARDEQLRQARDEIAQLKSEAARLQKEQHSARAELEKTIAQYKTKLGELEKGSETQIKKLSGELRKGLEQQAELQSRLKSEEELRESARIEIQRSTQKLSKERDDLLQLAMSRGKAMQDKAKDIKTLEEKLQATEKKIRDIEKKHELEAEALSSNAQVRKLRESVTKQQSKYEQLSKQFEAYKKHSGSLLEEEKKLNARLRHIHT